MLFYVSNVVSYEFANTFYYCYLFSTSVDFVVTNRVTRFSDWTDWSSSFLFNLLAQSISINNIYTNIANLNNYTLQGNKTMYP